MDDEEFTPDTRFYGVRYHQSAGEDLYQVAGRILSDLKVDQHEDRMPTHAILVVVVNGNTITVQVHLQIGESEEWGSETIRSQVTTVMDRYNWIGKRNRADKRYRAVCNVRSVRDRIDAALLGSIIG